MHWLLSVLSAILKLLFWTAAVVGGIILVAYIYEKEKSEEKKRRTAEEGQRRQALEAKRREEWEQTLVQRSVRYGSDTSIGKLMELIVRLPDSAWHLDNHRSDVIPNPKTHVEEWTLSTTTERGVAIRIRARRLLEWYYSTQYETEMTRAETIYAAFVSDDEVDGFRHALTQYFPDIETKLGDYIRQIADKACSSRDRRIKDAL